MSWNYLYEQIQYFRCIAFLTYSEHVGNDMADKCTIAGTYLWMLWYFVL